MKNICIKYIKYIKKYIWIIIISIFWLIYLRVHLLNKSYKESLIINNTDYTLETILRENKSNLDASKIPNIIWSFWDGPEKDDFLKKCEDSWKKYNPSYDIRILNKTTYKNYTNIVIEDIKHSSNSVQRYSDYIRLAILSKYGGIWIDASIICHRSFKWIHDIQNKLNVEFIGYYLSDFTENNYFQTSPVIESWFFACIPNSLFVNDWKNEFFSTNNYNTINDYLKNIEEQKISTQKISLLNYLSIHVSCQKVLQTNKNNKYNIYVMSACDGPFNAGCEENSLLHDAKTIIHNLTNNETYKKYHDYPFIKLTGDHKNAINSTTNIDNFFSHLYL
jgi:hypothetical protein